MQGSPDTHAFLHKNHLSPPSCNLLYNYLTWDVSLTGHRLSSHVAMPGTQLGLNQYLAVIGIKASHPSMSQ